MIHSICSRHSQYLSGPAHTDALLSEMIMVSVTGAGTDHCLRCHGHEMQHIDHWSQDTCVTRVQMMTTLSQYW